MLVAVYGQQARISKLVLNASWRDVHAKRPRPLQWNLKTSAIYASATHFFAGVADQAFTEEFFENITHGRNG
jgi:hypothetical protein